MEMFFLGDSDSAMQASEGIQRCPFLRNIHEPTNFSFASSLSLPNAVPGAKGPIFEDGPNFDMAFKLFHGMDGVVPLSGRSSAAAAALDEDLEQEQLAKPPRFNPLAAKAATISLSGFGGPFGFDFFAKKWNKPNKKHEKSSKKGGNSSPEVLSNEWLETGQCPIAKSYRAVSSVVPLVAKAFQPPPGMKFNCPPAIMAAWEALARTAPVKKTRPQLLPAKMLAIGLLGMAANVSLGIWREHTEKFSPQWFAAVHVAVPFIAMLRKSVLMPKTAMAFTIAASILGQTIGSIAVRHWMKVEAAKNTGGITSNAAMDSGAITSNPVVPFEKSTAMDTVGMSRSADISLEYRGQCGEGEVRAWKIALKATCGESSTSAAPATTVCY